jgi:Zn-dependent M28 family amino/carboxypeptidase
MRRLAGLLFLLVASCATPSLEDHVRFLASEELGGRKVGSDGERKAGEYIASQLRRSGIEPVFQPFSFHGIEGRNVAGIIRGASDEVVVLGAHYDHPPSDAKGFHPGADDNASGTSALLELARRLALRPCTRPVVVLFFSGEEDGLLGSNHYVNHPLIPLEKTVAMINLDMVGRLRDPLIVFGADTGDRFKEFLADSPLRIAYNKDPIGASDHTSFYLKNIPVVHFFTGVHPDWHKPTDTPDKLDFDGMRKVAGVVETLVRRVADAPKRLQFNKVPMAAPTARRGTGVWFGSMPDYSFEGKGTRLAGVAEGSPAQKAGLKEGDVILAFDGKEVDTVQAYSNLLFARKPGDEVKVAYDRSGVRHEVTVKLGARPKPPE